MVSDSWYDRIRVVLRCAGCEPYSHWHRGFRILNEDRENDAVIKYVESKFQKPEGQGIVIMPLGFGNIEGEEQESTIREGERYRQALKDNGLESEVLVNNRGPEDITSFAVYVYIPLFGRVQHYLPGPSKAQVHFRVTMYGQRVENPIRHDVMVELTLKSDSPWGWRIDEPAPAHCNGGDIPIRGKGQTQSIAITDWLRSLISHLDYVPAYKKGQNDDDN